MRVRLETIGCRLNISEIETMARAFIAQGHRISAAGDPVDVVVFNTCAVTHQASRTSRQVLRQLQRSHPHAKLVVTGCYATLEGQRMSDLGADLVVSNAEKDRLPALLVEAGLLHSADPIPADDRTAYDSLPTGRTRAFIKVQDGCDNRCTFCIVTVARGIGRSRTVANVVAEVQDLVAEGYTEVVLSGVHLGSMGHDLGDPRGLETLVKAILAETDVARIRLSSLEPWDLDAGFFELWAGQPRLLPHLHLPLQSGCDATLRRMARRTTQASFAKLLAEARAAIPNVAISTDVIVGFPGETEAEFAESLAFVEAMAFSRLHIFRYSTRAGTAAANMAGQVDKQTLGAHSQQMHGVGAALEQAFLRQQVGQRQVVLFESSETYGPVRRWSGLTGNYLRVLAEAPPELDFENQVMDVGLVAVMPGALLGRIPNVSPMVLPTGLDLLPLANGVTSAAE